MLFVFPIHRHEYRHPADNTCSVPSSLHTRRTHFAPTRLPYFALLIVILATTLSRADDHYVLTGDQVKAGFLLNFMRFIEWPQRSFINPSSPLTACIIGDASITALLTEAAAGKLISGRPILIKAARPTDPVRSCHIVFIAYADDKQLLRILETLKDTSTLTVGQSSAFLRHGIINFVTEDKRVRLEINVEAAARARLKISARLLSVSRLVYYKSAGGE